MATDTSTSSFAGLNKSMSGADIRHRLAYSSLYELPVGKGRRWEPGNKVGGYRDRRMDRWRHPGSPHRTAIRSDGSTNRLNAFSESQRPNLLRNPNLPGGRSRDEMIRQFFDTSAFQAPGDGIVGNAARTSGPARDFSG